MASNQTCYMWWQGENNINNMLKCFKPHWSQLHRFCLHSRLHKFWESLKRMATRNSWLVIFDYSVLHPKKIGMDIFKSQPRMNQNLHWSAHLLSNLFHLWEAGHIFQTWCMVENQYLCLESKANLYRILAKIKEWIKKTYETL